MQNITKWTSLLNRNAMGFTYKRRRDAIHDLKEDTYFLDLTLFRELTGSLV